MAKKVTGPKFEEPFEETQELFDEKIRASGLDSDVNIVVLVSNISKQIFSIVKIGDREKYRSGDDINIIINQKIFDQLTEPQRHVVAEEALASISYDYEKERVVISKPDVITFSSILAKFKTETYLELNELIKLLFSQDKDSAE